MKPANQPIVTDEELAARGDLVTLHERYGRRLVVFLASRAGNAAEPDDLAQEVWSKVWTQLSSGPFSGHFRGWLFSIARNLVIDHIRRKRPELLSDEQELPGTANDPLDVLIHGEEMHQLRRCLEQLPPQQADVLRRQLGGMKPAVIAETVQVAVERVHRQLYDAKKAMTECMKRGSR